MKVKAWDGPIPQEEPWQLLQNGLAVPDFKIYTSGMTVDADNPDIVRMIGSSTEKDMMGDTMDVNALADMTNAPKGLLIWLNHNYDLPGSIFGSLIEQPTLVQQGGVADIHISSDVEKSNPAALQTYGYIKNGRRIGCSVGCMVLEYEIDEESMDDDDYWFFAPIIIQSVLVLEWSVVGVPANQRCWVESALKGVFSRTFNPKLAPAVKGLYPRQYGDIIAACPDKTLRRELERTPARPSSPSRVEWVPLTRTFVMNTRGRVETVAPEQAVSLIAKSASNVKLASGLPVQRQVKKGACGKTSWPLADRERAWDNGEAHKRIVEWAGGNDDYSVSKLKQVHFWAADSAKELGDFKLLFCDVVDGDIKAIPRAVFACAGSHGVDSADIPDDDRDPVKAKIKKYYDRMADEFNDPDIKVPWEDDDTKSATPAVTGDAKPDKEKGAMPVEGEEKETEKEETPPPAIPALDAHKAGLLEYYNNIGLVLGLPAVTLDASGAFLLQRAGRKHSAETEEQFKAIHMALRKMTDDKICDMDDASIEGDGDKSNDGDGDDGDASGDSKAPADGSKSLRHLSIVDSVRTELAQIVQKAVSEHLDSITKALSGLNTKAMEQSVATAQAQLLGVKKQIDDAQSQIQQTAQTALALHNMPVGRPTNQHRSVHPTDNATSYADLMKLAGGVEPQTPDKWKGTLEDALAQCGFEDLSIGSGYTAKYRVWPEGVGGDTRKGVRPALAASQKSLMRPEWIVAYNEGHEAKVPLVDSSEIAQASQAQETQV